MQQGNNFRQPAGRRPAAFDPGPPTRWDLAAVLLYGALFLSGATVLLGASGLFTDYFASPVYAEFAANLLIYTLLFAVMITASFTAFKESLQTFARRSWLKFTMLPTAWLAVAVLSTALVYRLGGPVKSENQLVVEGMTTAIPFLPMMVMAVFLGPYVEEYLFRHLLIGKLSRYLNVWVCVGVSVLLFAGLHFLGGRGVEPAAVIPYLLIGAAISVAYVLSGRALAYAYSLHVVNNLIALIVTYTVLPAVSAVS